MTDTKRTPAQLVISNAIHNIKLALNGTMNGSTPTSTSVKS